MRPASGARPARIPRTSGRAAGRYDSGDSFLALALDQIPLPDYSRRGGKHQVSPRGSIWPVIFKWLAVALALTLAVVAGAVMVEQYHGGRSMHSTWKALSKGEPGAAALPNPVPITLKPQFVMAKPAGDGPAADGLHAAATASATAAAAAGGQALPALLPSRVSAAGVHTDVHGAHGAAAIIPMVTNVPEYKQTPASLAQLRKAASAMDPELMASVPQSFDPRFKNPCSAAKDGSLRCLPYFFIAGCTHSGAGTLAQKLAEHPGILTAGAVGTTPEFWVDESLTMSAYLDSFAGAAKKVAKEPTNFVIMDYSPRTFPIYWSSDMRAHRAFQKSASACWKGCTDAATKGGPSTETCAAAKCLQEAGVADKKAAEDAGILYMDMHLPLLMSAAYGTSAPWILVMARDPIARIHSAYWAEPHYSKKHGKTAEGFLAYVKEQVAAFKMCMATGKSDRECAEYFESLSWEQERVFYHCDQLIRGMYSIFLESWLRFIPRDRILIVKSEEYFADSKQYLLRIGKFLGLHDPDGPTLKAMDVSGLPTSHTEGQPEMHPDAKQLLVAFYKPYNLRLAQITGNPLFIGWTVNAG